MKKPETKRGYILISVIVIMTIMLIITFFLADALFSGLAIARNQKAATVAFNLAEAGVSDAIWTIQNDFLASQTFLNSVDGLTNIPEKTLIQDGTYSVQIRNNAKASATITSTGHYRFGLRQAQRIITLNVIQPFEPPPYTVDGVLMVGGPNPGDIYINNTTINYNPAFGPSSLISAGKIYFDNDIVNFSNNVMANDTITMSNSTLNIGQNIYSNKTITNINSIVNQGGVTQGNYPLPTFNLPQVDITSNCVVNLNSYKCLAQSQNQYYTATQFNNLIKTQKTFNGIIYVSSGGIIINNNDIVVNGVLVSEGTIYLNNATLTITHPVAPATGPSGLLTLASIDV